MFSDSGSKIMSGAGLASVKQRIEAAFRAARTNVRTHSAETRIEPVELEEIEVKVVLEVKQTEHVERTLEEKVSLYVRAAEKHIQRVVARRHHGGVYHISVPTEDAATLINQALRNWR